MIILYTISILAIPVWVIVYSVCWDGHYCVYVGMFGDWELLWCPIFVDDNWDGYCVGVFFRCHSSPMNRL